MQNQGPIIRLLTKEIISYLKILLKKQYRMQMVMIVGISTLADSAIILSIYGWPRGQRDWVGKGSHCILRELEVLLGR